MVVVIVKISLQHFKILCVEEY